MKFDCGPTPAEKRAILQQTLQEEWARRKGWHLYFALLPRRVGSHDCRWLEWIERKGTFHPGYWDVSSCWTYEYRPLTSPTEEKS